MILYLDASALVKRYVNEPGTQEVKNWIMAGRPAATGLLTRGEVSAAICQAIRFGWVDKEEGQRALSTFREEWETFGRLPILEATVRRAEELACRYNLRGYAAVHLACALLYQDGLGLPVTLVTFDQALGEAAIAECMARLPEKSG